MARERLVPVLIACLPGCSLLLDFSDKAGVHDASIDGPYTADECAYREPNDTADTASVIDVTADMGPGAICPVDPASGLVQDNDFYRFTVPAGTVKTSISLAFTERPGGDLDLILFDTMSAMISQSRGFTDTETIVCPAASPACPTLAAGDYVIEVVPANPAYVNNYTFTVTLQ